ncbi:hypothetical protein [Flavihumibacter sp. CACIAM 22H1]|uniref:hypothetical protein n=1 Tax=Flavihumibacter sp. CACIAM 22H1 TaxID=1812911 RepID=UPI0007A8C99A|nr:hypothetical protein [Flavihumibacter sp. CACIAM 22H1]KYP13034.1 MAG: hypothetical protein A1D16_04840 [Flavihumibacter sp. CACIAM 22H1]
MKKGRRIWIGIGVGLAVVLIVVALIWAFSGKKTPDATPAPGGRKVVDPVGDTFKDKQANPNVSLR